MTFYLQRNFLIPGKNLLNKIKFFNSTFFMIPTAEDSQKIVTLVKNNNSSSYFMFRHIPLKSAS